MVRVPGRCHSSDKHVILYGWRWPVSTLFSAVLPSWTSLSWTSLALLAQYMNRPAQPTCSTIQWDWQPGCLLTPLISSRATELRSEASVVTTGHAYWPWGIVLSTSSHIHQNFDLGVWHLSPLSCLATKSPSEAGAHSEWPSSTGGLFFCWSPSWAGVLAYTQILWLGPTSHGPAS